MPISLVFFHIHVEKLHRQDHEPILRPLLIHGIDDGEWVHRWRVEMVSVEREHWIPSGALEELPLRFFGKSDDVAQRIP